METHPSARRRTGSPVRLDLIDDFGKLKQIPRCKVEELMLARTSEHIHASSCAYDGLCTFPTVTFRRCEKRHLNLKTAHFEHPNFCRTSSFARHRAIPSEAHIYASTRYTKVKGVACIHHKNTQIHFNECLLT